VHGLGTLATAFEHQRGSQLHDDAERRDSTAVVNFGGDCVVTPSATAVGCDIDEPKSGSDNVPSRAEQRTDCDFRRRGWQVHAPEPYLDRGLPPCTNQLTSWFVTRDRVLPISAGERRSTFQMVSILAKKGDDHTPRHLVVGHEGNDRLLCFKVYLDFSFRPCPAVPRDRPFCSSYMQSHVR